jgi:integrase
MVRGRKRASWYAVVTVDGKSVRTPLGYFPLEGCTATPRLYCKEAHDGAQGAQQPEQKIVAQNPDTFGTVAAAWLKAKVNDKIITERESRRVLNKNLLPVWENVPFGSIHRSDVMRDVLDKIPGDSICNHVVSIINSIFLFQTPRMPDEWTSPVNLKRVRRERAKPQQRVLTEDELRAVWKAASDGHEFGRFVKFLLLTAQRRDCVLNMTWNQVRGDTWFPSKEERSKGVPTSIKLPQLALDLLVQQSRDTNQVWAGCVAVSRQKRNFGTRCTKIKPWVLHDLRRTARTLMIKVRGADGKHRRIAATSISDTLRLRGLRPEDKTLPDDHKISPQKRMLLSGFGFFERAYNLLGSTASRQALVARRYRCRHFAIASGDPLPAALPVCAPPRLACELRRCSG